jgi:hypothetical protein
MDSFHYVSYVVNDKYGQIFKFDSNSNLSADRAIPKINIVEGLYNILKAEPSLDDVPKDIGHSKYLEKHFNRICLYSSFLIYIKREKSNRTTYLF